VTVLVLGIDPGIAITGYGLVRERPDGEVEAVAYGVVTTPANTPIGERLQQVYRGVCDLLETYQPVSAGIEKLLFGKNVTTAVSVGQARGVTLLALADCGLSITEYTPAEVKQAVAGYGNASKAQVQDMVRLLLGLDEVPRPDDAADALAVAITHLHAARYHRLLDE
jgi:crossover junction endodeoxyribonuclease RuvC